MAEKKEQVKPLAPAAVAHRSDACERGEFSVEFKVHSCRRQKYIKCCGCSTAILLILVMILLALALTVFRIKDMTIRMNAVKIDGLDALNGGSNSFRGSNVTLTLMTNVSVRNPNAAAFKFDNMTTSVYYDGSDVGEVRSPAGKIPARKTMRMNVTVEVMVDKIVGVGRFERDLGAGIFPISTYTRISGKVKFTNVVSRSVVVKMNCTMNVNATTQAVQDSSDCTKRVSW